MKSSVLRVLLAFGLSLMLGGCGTTTSGVGDIVDIASFTLVEGCGTGFWVGNPDQTAALRFSFESEGLPISTQLPDPDWNVELVDGKNLYANWCDDVIEEGELMPTEIRRLPVIGGNLEIIGEPPARFESGTLSLRATDLVLDVGGGDTHLLGDIDVENRSWGFFAG